MGDERTRGVAEPVKPAVFHILLSLADEPQHGYAIRAAVEERTDGAVRLWPATLYGTIRRLVEDGWIVALEGEEDPDDDGRRRYYGITAAGREVLRAETERLEALVAAARGTRALRRVG